MVQVMKKKDAAIFLFDKSGRAAKPWSDAGYLCYCVDIQHSVRKEIVKGNIHLVFGDVRSWVPPDNIRVKFVGAFPPCTHITTSGSTDWKTKGNFLLIDSLHLFTTALQVATWSGAPFFIENSKGLFSHYNRKPDYIFHPCDYAGYLPEEEQEQEAYTKETHLWVGNGFIMPRKKPILPLVSFFPHKKKKSPIYQMSPSKDRSDKRSETPRGFSIATFLSNEGR